MMPSDQTEDARLADQLLAIARNPILRHSVYERLGEYCHQCRNRLNSLKLSLYLARRGAVEGYAGTWDALDGHYLELELLIERVQVICRPMVLSRITVGLDLLIEDRRQEWTSILAGRGGDLSFIAPTDRALASLDIDRMILGLDALARWRSVAVAPGTTTRIRWWVDAGWAHLAWEEDPPRARFTLGTDPSPDRTWTLSLLARVAAEHDGELRLNDRLGWRLELTWPSDPR